LRKSTIEILLVLPARAPPCPAAYRKFGVPAETKFSLKTKNPDEAELRCAEAYLKLERQWRATFVGVPTN
jgi:hypothetical protein